jgi:hypothetical protein
LGALLLAFAMLAQSRSENTQNDQLAVMKKLVV